MADVDYEEFSDEELENIKITFVPKKCPKCKELMVCKNLGVWGYYCEACMFWWGTYEPFPEVKGEPKK
ncbi:MAG: hypothetical protein KJ583_03035 [Nanoarchaeota archaeon]|nr:hypothetical protein [Nanoarchaeota archaeon]MBU1269874.1 hypothetical protein [Nanoarchaeota archaeon]MBU1604270.1 hypothetical protein [Nanoarchaeota archaeon]MBU2443678.1 hypothetical protein [Nanoarchaeota archaeon]